MQDNNHTYFNRYSYLWDKIKDMDFKTILSYGCSTGEEAITAQAYFPEANVLGYDTNEVIIRIANFRFDQGFTTDWHNEVLEHDYDLILCNSVLCNHPENDQKQRNELMTFEYFASECKKLDSLLLPGGVLMMMNAEYRFQDVGLNYEHIGVIVNHQVGVFNKFGKATSRRGYALWRKKLKLTVLK